MNNIFITLGTGCQFLLSVYFISKLFSQKTRGRLRFQYALSALLFGGFGSMLIYSWLQFGDPQKNLADLTSSEKRTKFTANQTRKMVRTKNQSELVAYIK